MDAVNLHVERTVKQHSRDTLQGGWYTELGLAAIPGYDEPPGLEEVLGVLQTVVCV